MAVVTLQEEFDARRGVSLQLASALRTQLRSGRFQPGERFPAVRELMEQTRLGYSVVNRAVAMLAEEGWLEQRPRVGTFVRAGESSKPQPQPPQVSTKRIGVVLPAWSVSPSHFVVGSILGGITREADQRDFRVEIIHNRTGEASNFEFVEKVARRDLDGIVWVQPLPIHEVNLARLVDRGMPLAITGRRFPSLPVPAIHEDVKQAATLVADLMVAQGRKQLVVLSGELLDAYSADRIAALRQAMQERGLELPDENICVSFCHCCGNGPHSRDKDLYVAEFLKNHPGFDTIFSLHPNPLGPVAELHTSGHKRCPEDFTLIQMGPACEPVRQQWPQLPMFTVEWPLEAIGRGAVEELEKRWAIPSTNQPAVDLSPWLTAPDGSVAGGRAHDGTGGTQ